MIKIMLKRRKENDTYLAADRRHRRSREKSSTYPTHAWRLPQGDKRLKKNFKIIASSQQRGFYQL
jgi:hypothetical protein